uniref:Uncharacterized protein n=1 Tax=Klebsiella pneumoniae TaxID=573 RepID=A0A8B0SVS4_KLEPN|nr:hypothetical protein [Klebsiella pneumoniae]
MRGCSSAAPTFQVTVPGSSAIHGPMGSEKHCQIAFAVFCAPLLYEI